jgi:hypothetical protein
MNHLSEEDLISYREDDAKPAAAIAAHLKDCEQCRAEFTRLNEELTTVFAALDTLEVPDAGEGYAQQVWKEISPKLESHRGRARARDEKAPWWRDWFSPRRLIAVSAVTALVMLAFFAGRGTNKNNVPEAVSAASMREKVLLLVVGEHLGRSEMMLTELSNTSAQSGAGKMIDISAEQKRAEDLLEENRLYRETALEQGDAGVASVLDELERVLLDVAHAPGEISGPQLLAIQQRIEADGLLFKVRVVGQELERRQRATPAANSGLQQNRKKV